MTIRITLSLDDILFQSSVSYAEKNGVSFNVLVQRLLRREVFQTSRAWLNQIPSSAPNCHDIPDEREPALIGRST